MLLKGLAVDRHSVAFSSRASQGLSQPAGALWSSACGWLSALCCFMQSLMTGKALKHQIKTCAVALCLASDAVLLVFHCSCHLQPFHWFLLHPCAALLGASAVIPQLCLERKEQNETHAFWRHNGSLYTQQQPEAVSGKGCTCTSHDSQAAARILMQTAHLCHILSCVDLISPTGAGMWLITGSIPCRLPSSGSCWEQCAVNHGICSIDGWGYYAVRVVALIVLLLACILSSGQLCHSCP